MAKKVSWYKLVSLAVVIWQNKLDCLFSLKIFQNKQMFANKSGACLSAAFYFRLLIPSWSIRLNYKDSSLQRFGKSTKKKFYSNNLIVKYKSGRLPTHSHTHITKLCKVSKKKILFWNFQTENKSFENGFFIYFKVPSKNNVR